MTEYCTLAKWKHIKGIFKKRVAGEFLLIGVNRGEGVIVFQVFRHVKDDLYICGIVGGFSSSVVEERENYIDMLRYNNLIEVIEDKILVKIKGPKYTFTKPSKYMGKQFELLTHSQLPSGYYMLKAKMKKGFEPAIEYEKGKEPLKDLTIAKQLRAFSTSHIKRITKG